MKESKAQMVRLVGKWFHAHKNPKLSSRFS